MITLMSLCVCVCVCVCVYVCDIKMVDGRCVCVKRQSFDVVIDKSCLDAMLSDEGDNIGLIEAAHFHTILYLFRLATAFFLESRRVFVWLGTRITVKNIDRLGHQCGTW